MFLRHPAGCRYLGDLGLVFLLAFLQGREVMAGAVEVHHLPVPLCNAGLRQSFGLGFAVVREAEGGTELHVGFVVDP